MKTFLALTILLLLNYLALGQRIGLRADTEISNNKTINNALGLGTYINLNNFSERFEINVYADYTRNERELTDCFTCPTADILTKYQRSLLGISGLYKIPLNDKLYFKFGPNINYSWLNVTEKGMISRWIESHKTNYTGLGIAMNLNFHRVFGLPIDFDLFVTPDYLIKVKDHDHQSAYFDYSENLKILNIQFGISYALKKKE